MTNADKYLHLDRIMFEEKLNCYINYKRRSKLLLEKAKEDRGELSVKLKIVQVRHQSFVKSNSAPSHSHRLNGTYTESSKSIGIMGQQ